jgi:hypothetical protein
METILILNHVFSNIGIREMPALLSYSKERQTMLDINLNTVVFHYICK